MQSPQCVKHLSFPIPGCLSAGQYNLTIYESSIIENQPFFSVTPVPIVITGTGTPAPCTTQGNPVQSQPQPSSQAPENPWLRGTGGQQSPFPGPPGPSANPGVLTITVGPDGSLPSPFPPLLTTTVLASPTTVTVVLVSIETDTVTTTESGRREVYTTTYGKSSTSTAVINPAPTDLSGFVPVNAAPISDASVHSRLLLLGFSTFLLLWWL